MRRATRTKNESEKHISFAHRSCTSLGPRAKQNLPIPQFNHYIPRLRVLCLKGRTVTARRNEKIIEHVVRSTHLLKRRKRSALLPDVGLVHLVSQHNHLFVDSHLSASMWRRGIGGAGYGRVKQLACWTAVAVNLTTLSILNLRRISCLHLSNWGATCQQRLAGLTTFYYLLPRFATSDHRFCCSLKAWTTKYRDCYTQNESGCGDKRSAIVSRPNRYWCGSPKRRCL